jgi:hypothetical protein
MYEDNHPSAETRLYEPEQGGALPYKGDGTMRLVFIEHPFHDNPEKNRRIVQRICRDICDNEPDVIPLAPHLALSFLDETTERDRALASCVEIISGCQELRFYGTKITEGMEIGIQAAHQCGIPVFHKPMPRGIE